MDLEHWMKQGWLDSVISQGTPPNPKLIAVAKAHKCPFIFNYNTANLPNSSDIAKQWILGYGAGVDGFAVWDIDALQDSPALWPVVQRGGHPKEIEAAAQAAPVIPIIKLKTVGGVDVLWEGLGGVSSGG